MIRAVTIFALALALAAPATAQIYRWTDAKGVEHFSADLGAVPPAHRAAAEASAGRSSGAGLTRYQAPATPEPAPEEPEEYVGSAEPAAQDEGELVGGHDEAWWRERHRRFLDEIETLEAAEERCQGIRPPSHGTKRQHYERKMEVVNRCAASRSTLDATRLQLENFLENARQQGVPPGWVR